MNLAGMAEADIGEHLVKGPQGNVSVCTGEVPRADICESDGEVLNLDICDGDGEVPNLDIKVKGKVDQGQ